MWHTDSFDTFESHFSPYSLFEDKQIEDFWVTKITIYHWEIKDQKLDQKFDESTNQNDRKGFKFPPESIMAQQKKRSLRHPDGTTQTMKSMSNYADLDDSQKQEMKNLEDLARLGLNQEKIGKRSSSIAITGEKKGGLWTCLVLSAVMDEAAMKDYVHELPETLNIFIHQQSSGRCLAFLILLGHLCKHLHDEYEKILEKLTAIVDIGV